MCSNALYDLPAILAARPDVAALFDVQVISVLVGMRKPDPEIFRLTAKRLDLPLSACLLVDDKARNTTAALALGMPAILFQTVGQLAVELAARGLYRLPSKV